MGAAGRLRWATPVCFWLPDSTGVYQIATLACIFFFSGMLLPLSLFPGRLGEPARPLPWSAMLQIP